MRPAATVASTLERHGEQCTRELVRRIMRGLGLEPCQPQPWRLGLTEPSASLLPDLVARDFTATAPARKWSAISLTSHLGGMGVSRHGHRLPY
jgi:hypothetical protein